MGGQVLFQDALAARLDLIQPSKSDITTYLEQRDRLATGSSSSDKTHRLTPGVQSLVNKLHAKGKIVYLISGGFRQVHLLMFMVLLILVLSSEDDKPNCVIFLCLYVFGNSVY